MSWFIVEKSDNNGGCWENNEIQNLAALNSRPVSFILIMYKTNVRDLILSEVYEATNWIQ